MWERIRFARYALRFERAFKTDHWSEHGAELGDTMNAAECRAWGALIGVVYS